MRRIQVGIGGLFLLWAIGIAIWAAVALAQIARGETATPPRAVAATAHRGPFVISLAPSSASSASSALFDAEGRRAVAEGIGSFDPGPHGVPLAQELSPGACRLMLRRQGIEGETRMVVLH